MSMKVILSLTVAENRAADFEAFFADMRAKVAAEEPGTLQFDMHRVQGQPGRFLMLEEYADRAAWDFHSVKQGERNVIAQMAQFEPSAPDFMFLEPVAGPLR